MARKDEIGAKQHRNSAERPFWNPRAKNQNSESFDVHMLLPNPQGTLPDSKSWGRRIYIFIYLFIPHLPGEGC